MAGQPPCRHGARPGERLPDGPVIVDGRRCRLHDLTAEPGVHLLFERDAPRLGSGPYVGSHRIGSWRGSGTIAVRPDGYVGYGSAVADPDQVRSWLEMIGLGAGTFTSAAV